MTYKDVEKMDNETLLKNYKDLTYSIDVVECFGTNDVVLLDWVIRELDRREE